MSSNFLYSLIPDFFYFIFSVVCATTPSISHIVIPCLNATLRIQVCFLLFLLTSPIPCFLEKVIFYYEIMFCSVCSAEPHGPKWGMVSLQGLKSAGTGATWDPWAPLENLQDSVWDLCGTMLWGRPPLMWHVPFTCVIFLSPPSCLFFSSFVFVNTSWLPRCSVLFLLVQDLCSPTYPIKHRPRKKEHP